MILSWDKLIEKRSAKAAELQAFKEATQAYSAFMGRYNRPIGSWNIKSLDILAEKPSEEIQARADSLQRHLKYYMDAEVENIPPASETQILWRILQSENWRFSDDLFAHISNTDVIEIYYPDFTQYFANSVFMMNCSYDLSDLHAHSWPELFERPEFCTRKIITQTQKILSEPKMKTYFLDVEKHIGKEVFSKERRLLEIEMGIVSPVFDQHDKLVSFVATFKPRQVSH